MKHKISIPVLVLIVVCTLAAIALIQRALSHRNASVRTETAGLLPKFQADDVARFRLSWRDMAVTLVKNKNGVWTVEERALPADPKKVLEFLEAAASIRPLKLIAPADEKTLLRLRTFVQGFNGAIPGARLEMQDKNGKELLNLAMGRGHFLPDDTTPPDQRVPSGRYFALLDSKLNPGSVFLAPTIFEDAPPVPGAWLRQPVFENLNAALGILFRDLPKGRIQWTVSRPDPSRAFEDASGGLRPVARQNISTLLSALAFRSAVDAFPRSHYKNLEPAFAELIITDAYGLSRKAVFHRLKGDSSKVVFTLDARIYRQVKMPGLDQQKLIDRFLFSGKDVCYEMPMPLFNELTAAPFELPKTKKPHKK